MEIRDIMVCKNCGVLFNADKCTYLISENGNKTIICPVCKYVTVD